MNRQPHDQQPADEISGRYDADDLGLPSFTEQQVQSILSWTVLILSVLVALVLAALVLIQYLRSASIALLLSAACLVALDDGPDFLVENDRESHLIAGALVAWGIDAALHDQPWYVRWPVAIGSAWLLGYAKEHAYDSKPDNRDANEWALGATLTMTVRLKF